MAAFLNHPEVGPILREAARLRFSPEVLNGRLQRTEWYRHNTEAVRQYEIDLNEDKETTLGRVRLAAARLWDMTQNMGLKLDARIFNQIAEDWVKFGWDETQLRDVVGKWIKYDPNNAEPVGTIGISVADLKAQAQEYFIDLSDEEAFNLAARIERQELTPEAANLLFRSRAKARYGQLAEMIDNGITPSDYFAEHRQAIARTLGMAPSQIDFVKDPKWMGVVEYVDSKGVRRPMTVGESVNFARHDDRFETTDQGRQQGAQFGLALAKEMGLMARG
jgi:hypothetical protein